MFCAKCGSQISQGSNDCPKCGPVKEFAPQAPPRKIKPIVYVLATLALVILGSIIFAAVMASRAPQNVTSANSAGPGPGGQITTAPPGTPPGNSVLTAPPGVPGASGPPKPGATKPKPPDDVVKYLEFVKKVEGHRQMLLKDTGAALMLSAGTGQAQSLMNLIDMAMDPDGAEARDPLADSKKELNRQYKNWLSTIQFFDKQAAPDVCREFSGAYRQVLFLEAKTIGEIAVSFNSVNVMDPKDMSKLLSALQNMKRDTSIQSNIDTSADGADKKLTDLVSNYDMKKPFDVPKEQQSGGSITSF